MRIMCLNAASLLEADAFHDLESLVRAGELRQFQSLLFIIKTLQLKWKSKELANRASPPKSSPPSSSPSTKCTNSCTLMWPPICHRLTASPFTFSRIQLRERRSVSLQVCLNSSIVIKAKDIQVFNVPQYEGLGIEQILEKGQDHPQIANYLPDERDIPRLPRSFIVNVTYTLMGEPFRNWVHAVIKERNNRIAENQKLIIELDPAVAIAFRDSVNISSKFRPPVMAISTCCFDSCFICSKQGYWSSPLEDRQQEKTLLGRDERAVRSEVARG